MKKNVKSSSIISVFIETLYVTPIAIFIIIFFEKNSLGALNIFSKLELILIPLTGVLTAIPQLLFAKGIKLAPLSLSGILMYINPFMQFLLGILIYKEQFSKIDSLTFIFIWIALIIYIKSCLLYTSPSPRD